MLTRDRFRPLLALRGRLLSVVVLLLSVGLSVEAWWLVRAEVRSTDAARFQRLSELNTEALLDRFDSMAEILRGAQAVVQVKPLITQSPYVFHLNIRMTTGVLELHWQRVGSLDGPAAGAQDRAPWD